jgi:hypothetical protein
MPREANIRRVGSAIQNRDDEIITNDLTVSEDLIVSGDASVGDALAVTGPLTFSDALEHTAQAVLTKTANYTMTEGDSGYLVKCATDNVVFTLPSTVVGYSYTFMNTGADGAAKISIDPAAIDKIMGCGLTAADNKDLINTKATARTGDYVRIQGDGVNGWFIVEMRGVWAREA